jgi:hypothetical protein
MTTSIIANTQQVLQMGAHAEKLQHTMQHLASTSAQQIQDEQVLTNELKQAEIQDPNKAEASDTTNSEGKQRRNIRLRNKSKQDNEIKNSVSNTSQENFFKDVSPQGQKINLTV